MKKIYSLLVLLLTMNLAFGQIIKNGSFEDWTANGICECDTLDNWITWYDYFAEDHPATQSNKSQEGSSSLLVQKSTFGVFPVRYTFAYESITKNSLTGYYQSDIVGDSARIYVLYHKKDSTSLAEKDMFISSSKNAWTFFQFKIKKDATADSITVGILPTAADSKNKIWVDNFKFDDFVDVNNPSLSIGIFPNPSNGVFNINLKHKSADQTSFKVLDITGKTIITGRASTQNFKVDLNGFTKGLYLLEVSNSIGNSVEKLYLK